MECRKFTRRFELEAVRLIRDRGASYATARRTWAKKFSDDPRHAFPDHGQMRPEQLEIARLKREVIKLKAT
jgi:transposase-like protein